MNIWTGYDYKNEPMSMEISEDDYKALLDKLDRNNLHVHRTTEDDLRFLRQYFKTPNPFYYLMKDDRIVADGSLYNIYDYLEGFE